MIAKPRKYFAGISLMFATELGLLGLWLGLDVGMLLEDIAVVIYFMKINWNLEAEKVCLIYHFRVITNILSLFNVSIIIQVQRGKLYFFDFHPFHRIPNTCVLIL